MYYRPEIDGLRAVAVTPVVLFHAGFNLFSGGFVGVDVFFVISGYLITSIIVKELLAGTFTLVGFYERRVRRILPALYFVMLICIPASWVLMVPREFQEFGQSLVATSFFSSNFLFWLESGYFDAAAELKPLLHTWSLAVEEQYYVLFPLFLLITWRWPSAITVAIILLAAILSLAGAQQLSGNLPEANFYLLPSRVWELLIGVLAAFYLSNKQPDFEIVGRKSGELLSFLGLVLILIAVVLFDGSTPFPGVYALVPTLGTVLIILFGVSTTLVGKWLSFKPVVSIGLISYSIYLWHYVMFAFLRIGNLHEPAKWTYALVIVISIGVAYLSWKYVECPFRDKTRIASRQVWSAAAFFTLIVAGAGMVIHEKKGFRDLFVESLDDRQKVLFASYEKSTKKVIDVMRDDDACRFWAADLSDEFIRRFSRCADSSTSKATLLIGDSHGMNVFNILFESHHSDFLVGIARGGCRPHNWDRCHYDQVLDFVATNKKSIDKVVYHQSGSHLLADRFGNTDSSLAFEEGQAFHVDKANVDAVVDYLKQLSLLVPVIWLGPFVEVRVDIVKLIDRSLPLMIDNIVFSRFRHLDKYLVGRLASKERVAYVSFDTLFEISRDFVYRQNCITYADIDHFSFCGEKLIGAHIRQL